MNLNTLKVKSILLILISLVYAFYFPSNAFSEEKFWIPEGELSYKINGSYLYLINQRESGTYYYGKYSEKKYTPVENNPTSESLKFNIIGLLPGNLKPHNFEKNKWNSITQLTFKHENKSFSIKKDEGKYWVYNSEIGFKQPEINCFPIDNIKSNYIINLEGHHVLLHQALKRTTNEIQEKKNETPFLELLEKSLNKDFKKQISFSKINNINSHLKCNSYNNLEYLYQSLIKKENDLQRKKLNDYHESYKKLHKELDNYRNHQNNLRDIKSGITGLMNKISLAEDKIENMKKSIRDKEKMIEAQKKIYQGNHEAHAEYGIYLFEYDMEPKKSFLEANDEIKILTIKSAMKDLSSVFIQSESRLQFDGKSGKEFFYDWIRTVKDGYITIIPTKDDFIPIGTFNNFVIKTVKYLPRIISPSDLHGLKGKNINADCSDKYKQFPVLNDAQLNEMLEYINDHKQIEVQKLEVIDRIKRKYDDILLRRQDVYNNRNDLFQKFIFEINKINKSISYQRDEIRVQKDNIEQHKSDITSRTKLAKEKYESAKKTLNQMNQISNDLIFKIINIFKFHLYDIGNSFQQENEKPIRHFSRLIKNILVSIDSRCNMVRETIKSTVENGFLVKEQSSSIELLKKYKTLSIFSDLAIAQGKYRIGYVVLKLETEIYTNSDLHPQSFDSHLVDLNDLWKEICELKDKKKILVDSANNKKVTSKRNITKHNTTANKLNIFNPRKELNRSESSIVQEDIIIFEPVQNNQFVKDEDFLPPVKCGDLSLTLGGRLFLFKYFHYDQLYDDISYNLRTPVSIAKSIRDCHRTWLLPTADDLSILIDHLKKGQKLPVDIFSKRLYISKPTYEKSKFYVMQINDSFQYKKDKIDSSDMAFLIFVSHE